MSVKSLTVIAVVVAVVALSAGGPLSTGVGGYIDGPLLVAGDHYRTNFDALVGGQLELDGDCLLLDGHPAIWPVGTTWDDDAVNVPGVGRVELGDTVVGGGGWVDVHSVGRSHGSLTAAVAGLCSSNGQVRLLQTNLRRGND